MLFPPKNKSKFCMSFKQKEIPVYNTMEEWLMDDLKIPTRSDVYKASLKNLITKENKYAWSWHEKSTSFPVVYEMARQLTRWWKSECKWSCRWSYCRRIQKKRSLRNGSKSNYAGIPTEASKLIATDIQDTRRDPTQVNIRMRVGETYAVRANDDPNYFFTVTIQPNPYSGALGN